MTTKMSILVRWNGSLKHKDRSRPNRCWPSADLSVLFIGTTWRSRSLAQTRTSCLHLEVADVLHRDEVGYRCGNAGYLGHVERRVTAAVETCRLVAPDGYDEHRLD